MNAVIYARYSSHGQTEQSIEGQLRDCYAYAERENLTVIGEYIDRAITGRTDERPDFQRMIADAAKKQFERVIVWKLDRFTRNRFDSAFYKSKLKKYGVKVVSATENISEEPEGIILEGLLESLAEYYSANLSKHVKRGQRESVINGTYLGGVTPLGFKVENKRLVADERTAPMVKYIFEEYANGASKKSILEELNNKGFRNSKGKPLTMSSLQTMMRSKKYIGIYTHGGREVTGGCDAITDEETFYKVQERLDENMHAPGHGKAKVEYQLQGKIFCGYCGSTMHGECGTSVTGARYHYYACRNRKIHHTCKKKNEKKEFIEWYVVEQTVQFVLCPAHIELIADALIEQHKKDFGKSRIAECEKHLAKLEHESTKLVDTLCICDEVARPPILERLKTVTLQKEDLEEEIAKLRIVSDYKYERKQIISWIKQFCKGDLFDLEFRRRIIDVFINAIYLYDDKVVIYYNLKDSKQVSYIEMLDSLEEPPNGNPYNMNDSSCIERSALPNRFKVEPV